MFIIRRNNEVFTKLFIIIFTILFHFGRYIIARNVMIIIYVNKTIGFDKRVTNTSDLFTGNERNTIYKIYRLG